MEPTSSREDQVFPEGHHPHASGVQPRVYRGRTVQELIPRIERELGTDAIIVQRRDGLTGGLAGFFQRRFVELEVLPGGPRLDLYDEDPASPALPDPQPFPSAPPAPEPRFQVSLPAAESQPAGQSPPSSYLSAHLAALARSQAVQPQRPPEPRPRDPPPFKPQQTPRFEGLRPEDFAPATSERRWQEPPVAQWRPVTVAPKRSSPPVSTRARGRIESRLIGLGMSVQFAAEIIDGALAHTLALTPRGGLARAVKDTLIQRIPVAPALPAQGAALVLVGAGGTGKTSCAAALLEAYRSGGVLPASCATLTHDPHKGTLQILLSPHIMKPTPIGTQRALRALQRTRSSGMAVLDTPALSPANPAAVRQLAGPLSDLGPERVVVVLPATVGAKAAAQLLEALAPLRANGLAITHADETDQIGVAIEAACSFGLAPEYLLSRGKSGGWKLGRVDPAALTAMLLR
jgi:flagellar biosynthesis GTPase FlhF